MTLQNRSKKGIIKSVLFLSVLMFCVSQCNKTKTLTVDDIIKKNMEGVTEEDAARLKKAFSNSEIHISWGINENY